jgi:pyochelin biosynthetic protein PchC
MQVDSGILSQRWLRNFHRNPQAQLRLVCFPHAGGAASFYRPWLKFLPPNVELVAVQYPGREDRVREPCVVDMSVLADLITEALEPALNRRIALFGHSMGAVVAYEVARRLEKRGHTSPVMLFVSSSPAPNCYRAELKHLLDDETLWAEIKHLGGTSELINNFDQVRVMALPVIRSDCRLSDSYKADPGAKLKCPIVAFLGDSDQEVRIDEMRGWAEVTDATFQVLVLAGNHFFLIRRREELVKEVVCCLEGLKLPSLG